jgi:C4-dicarboxylate-specific signal transduction histidine kinase
VKTKAALLVLVSLVFVLGGCKKAQELAKYKDQAIALSSKYAPQLADLGKKLPELLGRAKGLPVDLPGVSQVTKLLEDNKDSLDKLQGLLGNLPKQVTSGKGDEAKQALDSAEKELSTGLSTIDQNVKAAETQLSDLETKAKAGSGAAEPGSAAG